MCRHRVSATLVLSLLLDTALPIVISQSQLQPAIISTRWILKRAQNGNNLCSRDTPSESLTTSSRLRCQVACSTLAGCWNFNYFDLDNRCDLFRFTTATFSTLTPPSCQHYQFDFSQVQGGYVVPGFTPIRNQRNLYRVVFQNVEWTDGVDICSSFSPRSHMVIYETQQEQTDVSNYLRTLNSAQYSPCQSIPLPFIIGQSSAGYWTAGQRANPTVCQSATAKTEFRWNPNGGDSRQLNPSLLWDAGEPNCNGLLVSTLSLYLIEACVGITIADSSYLIDISCFYPRCPICELEM